MVDFKDKIDKKQMNAPHALDEVSEPLVVPDHLVDHAVAGNIRTPGYAMRTAELIRIGKVPSMLSIVQRRVCHKI